MPEERVKARSLNMGIMLPSFKFLLRERGFSLSSFDLFRIKSKADFTMRVSLYILVKLNLIAGNSLPRLKSCLVIAQRRGLCLRFSASVLP